MRDLEKICQRPRPPVIDLHTHTFNALYLPVIGIFVSWCRHFHVPRAIGIAVGVVVELMTLARSGERRRIPPVRAEEVSDDEMLARLLEDVPEGAIYDDRVREGIREAGGEPELAAATREPRRELVEHAVERLFKAFREAVPPSIFFEEDEQHAMEQANLREAAWRRWLRWIALLTERDTSIGQTLCESSPGVGLFIHHMMDMENWYFGTSFYNVRPMQLSRVRDLLAGSDGRLVPFVAFDPKRGSDLKNVKAGVELGCAGVKFYPANGYKPLGNKSRKIENANKALFAWCEERQVPLFTHCTPAGFEAEIGVSGCNADPELWRPVLKKYPRLRLCFGHAGGHEGWLGAMTGSSCGEGKAFAETVVELCADESLQVYCEIGYLNVLFGDTPRKQFVDRLAMWTRQWPVLKKRICFGTDWHMPAMVVHHSPDEYRRLFEDIFQDERLKGWRDAFFAGNAASYLDLRTYARRMTGILSDEAVNYLSGLQKE